MYLNLNFLLFFISTFISLKLINAKSNKCELITIPLCKNIGYNMTSYPNFYGHEGQEEAGLEVHQFYPLVEVGCYKHLKFFLCSMYTPICQENYDKSIMPCKEVCLDARKHCAPLMQQYGFKWPESLSCDQLPLASDQYITGEICAAPPDTLEEKDKKNKIHNHHQQKQKEIEKIIKNHHNNKDNNNDNDDDDYKLISANKFPIINIDIKNPKCECKCTKPFIVTSRPDNFVSNVSNCAYSCYSTALSKTDDKIFMNTWISIWSYTCLFLTLFTILTFLIDLKRFPYPERPIFYLSICQFMVALGFIIRIYYGQSEIACDGRILKTGTSATNGTCLLTFVLIYFFGMSASTWWVILSLSWVLAAVPNWSAEWISKYSVYFHIFAWILPLIKTVLIICFKAIDGDSLSGICYVGNTNVNNLRYFVLYPLLIYFIIGVCFLIIGFHNLWIIRSNLKNHQVEGTNKLTKLISKIGIFSFLYTLPAIFVILTLFYEQYYRSIYENSLLCPCSNIKVVENKDTSTLLSLIKIASMLIVGWTTGIWVISGKTIQSWKNFLCCNNKKIINHQPLLNHHYNTSNDGIPYMNTSIDINTMNNHHHHGYYIHNSNNTSPLNKYQQQNDIIFANHECISPLIYPNNGTLKHCGRIIPENV